MFGVVLLAAAVRIGRARGAATGALLATPLFAVLVALETTDIAFAVDSIPAVLGVTTDSFIVFASNAMAILGLRSLYFVVAAGLDRLRRLKTGLAVILGFIAAKMLAHDLVHVPAVVSLGVILAILAVTAVASLRGPGLAPSPASEVQP